jgi:endonuclease/exonuclease/phosphatase (EEP) superfamily protein YafD
VREAQATQLSEWLADRRGPLLVVGDFNAEPVERAYAVMVEAGFRSAYREANGQEPTSTWPSGIQAPGMDTDGDPGCLDYIWLRGALEALDARLAFDRSAADDPTLYPTDHVGVLATVRVLASPGSGA